MSVGERGVIKTSLTSPWSQFGSLSYVVRGYSASASADVFRQLLACLEK